MFEIEYKGANSVVFTTKKSTLVVDPKLSVAGQKDIVVKNAIEVATEARLVLNSADALLAVEGPGEYEIGDFSIRGISAHRHIDAETEPQLSTMYRIEVGDVRIALLGNITSKLSDEQLEELGVVDMLILPVGGGGYTLDATSAATITRQIEPRAIIPTHYADSALKYEVPQDTLDVFVKELGAPTEQVDKYKLKSAASLPAVMTVIELRRS